MTWVACANTDRGPVALKECSLSCIGCGKCVKTCTHDAVKVTGFLAAIDPEKCTGCHECVEACPRHCISTRESSDARCAETNCRKEVNS